jgi:hypothetical protein
MRNPLLNANSEILFLNHFCTKLEIQVKYPTSNEIKERDEFEARLFLCGVKPRKKTS